MKTILFGGVLVMAHATAAAGPIAPARYIDAQGVEVIHDRGVPGVDAGAGAALVRTSMPLPAASPKLTIAPAEQAARDRDRVAILEQELDTESHAVAELWSKLNPPARTPKPAPADTARMNERLAAHQKNIQALHAELRRARVALKGDRP